MRGDAKKLTKMLQGANTRFVIPIYQRNYDWKREQCQRLFDDLEDVIHEHRQSHFFGSIVSQSDYDDRRILIDGQQRITTTYLLLAALLEQIRQNHIEVNRASLYDFIRYEYLVDRYDESDQKLKLKLVKDDQNALTQVMNGNEENFVNGSNITENYRYFLDRIAHTDLNADQLKDAIESLEVIDIRLEPDDDAQLIFESLNSTGLGLSEGDKIRNFILMNLPEAEQETYYTKYWNPIEQNTDYDVSAFIRDYLTSRTRRTPVINRVYPVFRKFAANREMEPLLQELLKFSEYYGFIIGRLHTDPDMENALHRLGLLEMGVVNPFLLSVLEYSDSGYLSRKDLVSALDTVENYLFRRWVCGIGTNALNKVFEDLHYEALRAVADGAEYLEALKYALLRREASSRFPRDEEFKQAYWNRNFYTIGRKRLYLYDRLENSDNVERVNIVTMLEDGVLSVEHIMPQTLSRQWRKSLGEDASSIHKEWLNRMGNLTLTGYNSQYSNGEFLEKRDCDHGFADSGLKLNRYVANCDTWGRNEILQRQELIWKRFLTIWPQIDTTYHPTVKEYEQHTLDEDFDYRNRKIAAYTSQGARHPAKTWVEAIQGVLVSLYEIAPATIHTIADGDRFPARYFSHTQVNRGFAVSNNLWFNPESNTPTKIGIMRRIIEKIPEVENTDLSFELYDE
ncbi:DUF262 domain-containing protein [Bifidobacterium callimiconis]|uniref:DUF262 domain-containing protein n=1 Tax=Bifidobacterium callimiconis TaxID=2306973 RepID=UPI001BDCCF8A|nr:DUF262 domain-containing protein [Bifidobacterium callimiconis]MBT1176195.1 DUF262 domain-containing protein [Bifidobacterium callimiconis]